MNRHTKTPIPRCVPLVLVRRWGEVGAATVGAGALLAVTGGLAAPAIVAGLTATGTTIGVSVGALATTRHLPQKAQKYSLKRVLEP